MGSVSRGVSGGVSDEVLLARAFLNRVAEPASIPVWRLVRRVGPIEAAQHIRTGRFGSERFAAEAARATQADPAADLAVAQRHGIRLVVPEAAEWPHFAFAALEATGLRRLAEWDASKRAHRENGELVPPIALWVRGDADLATLGVRSVSIVGARAATEYGTWVARDLAARLAGHGFVVVSGGAHGIDAAAHRGALSMGRDTVLVSAGGLDRAYPPGNASLFEQVAESGALISESPPGAEPRRRRFLTRNRLIAALGTGTVVVEAAARSGATNTANHCASLGRPLMAVPGPVTSAASIGCHRLIAADQDAARLVTCAKDVLDTIGSSSDLPIDVEGPRRRGDPVGDVLDTLDPTARQIFDVFPARGSVGPERLATATGLTALTVIRTLPTLELAGLIEATDSGHRLARRG